MTTTTDLQRKRTAVRQGASMIARRPQTRIDALRSLGLQPTSHTLADLKAMLRSAMKSATTTDALHTKILQCIGGEIRLGKQPRN